MTGFSFLIAFAWLGLVTWRLRDLIREVTHERSDHDRLDGPDSDGGRDAHVVVPQSPQPLTNVVPSSNRWIDDSTFLDDFVGEDDHE